MIVYPKDWNLVGVPVTTERIERALLRIVMSIPCNYLALSGGVDSSLMLYFMARRWNRVHCFTIGSSEDHPDVIHARMVAKYFGVADNHRVYIPTAEEIAAEKRESDCPGDDAVRLFFKFVGKHTNGIITCDGIDEYMCGYYPHQSSPTEETYYRFLEALQTGHLQPLNSGSGDVKVYLPYLSQGMRLLLSQIPISRKVDEERRKKIMIEMADGCIPAAAIDRRKYGFCDAFRIKEEGKR